MSTSLPDTWWHEGARASLPLADLRALAQERKIEPNSLTWPEGGHESFPACWHLDVWFTYPDLYDAVRARSLAEIFFRDRAGLFGEKTNVCYSGAEFWEPLAEFDWAVPELLWPVEPELVGVAQTGLGGNFDHDVFISYQRKDEIIAKNFEAAFRKRGLKVWRDDRLHDTPGQPYDDKINEALTSSARVVVLWSRSAVQSTWVKAEATRAHKLEKLIPVLLEDTDLPAPFNVLHCLPPQIGVLLRALGIEETGEATEVATPAVDISKLPKTYAKRLYGRDAELQRLFEAWDGGVQRVVAFDAMGGAGKTALVYHFVQALKSAGWRGARRVFAWSFYSQGSNEDRQTSADEFFAAAIRFFGDEKAEVPKDPREKGVVLAKLVQARRSLLILDGLEPLQYAAGSSGGNDIARVGGIKDQGLRALLEDLALVNPGLCLVTTRIALAELVHSAGFRSEPLMRLPTRAGIELLRDLGVEPEFPPERFRLPSDRSDLSDSSDRSDGAILPERLLQDFTRAVEELGGHALALTLAGNYLVEHEQGLRALHDLPLREMHPENPERDPYRVMRAIEIALTRRIAEQLKGNPRLTAADTAAGKQLVLLFFLGFFDRPAETKLLPITFPPGTLLLHTSTCHLLAPRLSAGELRTALGSLSRQGLVTRVDAPVRWEDAQIDCHPLVREYFGARLAELDVAVHHAAHGRLYDHFRFAGLPVEFREPVAYALIALVAAYPQIKDQVGGVATRMTWPEGWKGVLPPTLLTADWDKVQAAAALIDTPVWNEALARFLPTDEAGMTPLFAAIGHGCQARRETEAWSEVYWPRVKRGNENYSTKKLGLYGQDLAALASFFPKPFAQPSPNLSPARQGLLLSSAGFRLRALGRPEDAVEPMRADTQMSVDQEDWQGTAIGASNLSELLVTLGRLDGPEGAVAVAADSVAYADRSRDAFQRLSRRTTHADALLRSGQARQAESLFREAERLQKDDQPDLPRLYSQRGYRYADLLLTCGRAEEAKERAENALRIVLQGSKNLLDIAVNQLTIARANSTLRNPHPEFPKALAALRRANDEDHIPCGLLAHAEASWLSGNRPEAEKLLAEAEVIATRGPMPLFAADAALLRARIALAAGDLPAARAKRDEAATLISRHGYGLRKPDLALLNAELGEPDTLRPAIAAVESEGWWALLPRLEALLAGRPEFTNDLHRLHTARKEYDRERDEYLAGQK